MRSVSNASTPVLVMQRNTAEGAVGSFVIVIVIMRRAALCMRGA